MVGDMMTKMKIVMAILLLFGAPLLVLAETPARAGKLIVSEDSKFAELAATCQRKGWNFDQIFRELCKTAQANLDRNPKVQVEDQARSIFGGLWIWTGRGGSAKIQGRSDWAFHFAGGGAFQGYWDLGRTAAVVKERRDSRDSGNRFDLDDMAATMLGARWVDLAANSEPVIGRRWLDLWASGQYSISQSLPTLRYGQLPQGQVAPPERIEEIRDAVDAALVVPSPHARQ